MAEAWFPPDHFIPGTVCQHSQDMCAKARFPVRISDRVKISNTEGTMLVFTRRVGETVVIAGNIRVTVLEAQGGKIRLGITAPDCVRVDREEIHERRLEGGLCEWNRMPIPV